MRMKTNVMGLQFDQVTMTDAVERAKALLETPNASYVVTPNAEMGYEALHDGQLRAILNGADLVLPDGAGVVLAAKILGRPLKQKVAGVDFAAELLGVLAQTGRTLYLLGGKPGVAQMAAEKMKQREPALAICGMADGYFQADADAIAAINEAKPDVLVVCLGAPKQEIFMAAHKQELDVRLMVGLGGTLDAFAGTVKRAPGWMIRCNLEWLYRLVKEPRRFGRMLRLPKYILAVIAERIRGKKKWEN